MKCTNCQADIYEGEDICLYCGEEVAPRAPVIHPDSQPAPKKKKKKEDEQDANSVSSATSC